MLIVSLKNTTAKIKPKIADKERMDDPLTTPIIFILCKYRYRDNANPNTPTAIIGIIWS